VIKDKSEGVSETRTLKLNMTMLTSTGSSGASSMCAEKDYKESHHYYEGCGEEGPIRSIFFAEFHPVKGPTVRCSVPENQTDLINNKDDSHILPFIIPKPELTDRVVTFNVQGKKICGFPRVIDDKKYQRNQLMFNVCFVCYPWSRTVQFEAPLKKLSEFLLNLELQLEFLSNEENTPRLVSLLDNVFNQLNETNAALMTVERNCLDLKVVFNRTDPPAVADWDVPVVCVTGSAMAECTKDWDLTSKQIIPHIDGCNHVARVSALADVEIGLVKACVQNLVYHRVARCINHVFQFDNQYMVTPEVRVFRENPDFRKEFMDYLYPPLPPSVKREEGFQPGSGDIKPRATFAQIFKLIADFKHGTTIKDICLSHRPKTTLGIDIFKLVQFLLLKGIVRRLHHYPVHMRLDNITKQRIEVGSGNLESGVLSVEDFAHRMFDGQHHLDEISMRCQLSTAQIMAIVDEDPDVICLTR